MELKDVWEYNICGEYYDKETNQQKYAGWNIISEENPTTAWPKIFALLVQDKEFNQLTRMGNVSAFPKKVLFA